ncbi:hypothetical protein CPB83DRAFT_862092 [Crepidotus variabilis]|uniref:Zn(2)-C6 fungal-type domain-containing protein n=1 Tax=Crepidotus variabilis TaxID=179855 RepID=A0A9P6E7C8_9AGAR|nr:hypothetical protein CPB83DRAFT_862092 [Crepidotus variabilis]
MHSETTVYSNDSRPPKRPRNVTFEEEPSVFRPQGEQYGEGPRNTSMNLPRSVPPVPSPTNRSRYEDKNTRKLSCAECRRLKLKCDRVFPCQSCVKRGCGSLCPEGALTSGRGSRFILANTEQLHDKIVELSGRVRQLEDALAHSSDVPHPLLNANLLKIKTYQDLYGTSNPPAIVNLPMQSQTPPREDQLRSSLNALSSLSLNAQPPYADISRPQEFPRESSPPEIGSDILQLSATFPFPWAVDVSIRRRIRDALPQKEDATRICHEARSNALWQFNLDASETFLPNLIHYCYATPIERLSPRRLALLLMYLSIGSIVDLSRPLGTLYGEAYHHLARAAVCEIPLMEEPDFDCLHALFCMMWYHLIFSDNKKAVGYAWNLMGFVAKLAQGLGLHRDNLGVGTKVLPEEHERRRSVFWELLNMDCRMSLSLRRPPSLCIAHVDTKPPSYAGPGIYVPQEEIVYHDWKHAFFVSCLTPVLDAMVSVNTPDYQKILELDCHVRDFRVPPILEEGNVLQTRSRFLVMQRGLVALSRDIAILQNHRKYFMEAMNVEHPLSVDHPFAPSVIATYIGACDIISTVNTLFEQEGQLCARFLHFCFNVYFAGRTLSLLIFRAPSSPLANIAFQDLERVCQLLKSAAKVQPFCGNAHGVIQRHYEKSRRLLVNANNIERIPYPDPGQADQVLAQQFSGAHRSIIEVAQRITVASRADSQHYGPAGYRTPAEVYLPDIYHFSSNVLQPLNPEDFASKPKMPFTPSSPRVDQNESLNFDYGALFSDNVEENSFMAWF